MKSLSLKKKIFLAVIAAIVGLIAVFAIDLTISAQRNVFADEFDTSSTTQDEYIEAIYDMCGGDVDKITDETIKQLVQDAIKDNSAFRAKWTLLSAKKALAPNNSQEVKAVDTVDNSASDDKTNSSNSNSNNETNQTYSVSVLVTDGGIVSGQGKYNKGAVATVKASPKAGYMFEGWFLDGKLLTTNNTFSQVFDKDTQLTASFKAMGEATLVIDNSDHVFSTITVNGKVYDGKSENPVIATYIGANIAITDMKPYEGTSDVNFKFWVDGSGKVLSTSLQYGFVVTSSTVIMPVADRSAQGYATVEFVSHYGQVVGGGQYKAQDTIVMPPVPYRAGYEAVGWELTAEQISQKIADGATNIMVKPVYKKNAGSTYLYVKYVDTDGKVIAGADPIEATEGSPVSPAVLDVPGYTFSCWKDKDGRVLSSDQSMIIYLHNSLEITAVYAGPGQTTIPDTVHITGVDKYKLLGKDGNKDKIVFRFFRHVPVNYNIIDSGVLYCRNESLATEDKLIVSNIDGKEIIKFNNFDNHTKDCSMFMAIAMKNPDTVVHARGYVQVQDNDGNAFIVYSNIIQGSLNTLGL